MPIHRIRLALKWTALDHQAARRLMMAFVAIGSVFVTSAAIAAVDLSEATARYREERAFCNSGQSYQDRTTCLREAGAALAEAKKGQLNDEPGVYQQNAMVRCDALPADDREACRRRIAGEGTISGSVFEGGLLRELVVRDD